MIGLEFRKRFLSQMEPEISESIVIPFRPGFEEGKVISVLDLFNVMYKLSLSTNGTNL